MRFYNPGGGNAILRPGVFVELQGFSRRWLRGFSVLLSVPLFLVLILAAQEKMPESALVAIQNRIASGDLGGAEISLRQALKVHPMDGGIYNLLGVIHAQERNYSTAESDFENAIRYSPGLTGAYLNLGRIYEMKADTAGNGARAELLYRELLKKQPGVVEARLQLAMVLEWRGAFRESLAELAKLPALDRQKSRVLALECANNAGIGRETDASKAAENLVRAPDLTDKDVRDILPALENGKHDALVVKLIAGLRDRGLASPENASPESLVRLAQAYARLNQLPEARKTLEDAQRQDPAKLEILLELARIAYKQHDLEGALGYLAHARDLAPAEARVHFLFGIVAAEMDLPLEAKKSLQKALDLDGGNANYNYAMGSVELQGKDVSLAIPYFKKYLELRPGDPRGKFALGVAEFGSGDYEGAKRDFTEAAARKETVAGAEYFLGRIAKVDADWKSAAEHEERSIAADSVYADSHAELALARMRLGEMDGARKELDRALAIDRNSYAANQNLLALYERTKDPRAAKQRQRVSELEAKRSRKQELMLRRIEVIPY